MSSNPQAPRWDETCESIEVFEFNRRIETNRAAIEESLIALRADLAVAKIRVDEKMSEVEASKTALNSRNEEYAILSTKFNDQATALEQVKSDGIAATGEVSNLKAQIESLTSRHQDQVKSDANAAAAEVSNLKAQMESLKSQHQAQLSASQATLKRKEEASAELLTFQHAVLRWHGIEDSESDVSVVEDFLDIARRAIQPEPAPVLPSLDGLRLIPADQHPISSNRSIHGQAIRFWYTCRVDAGVDPLAANGMLNSPLMDPAEWFMVPFLYKGLGILVQRLSQYDMTMILSLSEWYIIMLLRGLL
ncbi:MAG: hypothetical protein M1830_008070, partial [Pleopsidium flavum]